MKGQAMRAIMLSLALAVSAVSVSAPATATVDSCAVAPDRLRALLPAADAAATRSAERNIQLGEQLCVARNRPEANRKFNAAARALGTELATVLAAETTAAR
jgi:hypothetical protein